ncbi:MAG TPA: hypothetical protein VIU29_01510, partial [Candidatus Deferrimicrobiaceae bacterium]
MDATEHPRSRTQFRPRSGVAACASAVIVFALGIGIARWTTAGSRHWSSIGPDGGYVRTLAVDAGKSTVYAGTAAGGVYKSTDGGASWSAANRGLAELYGYPLVVDPAVPSTVYVGSLWHGVYKSIDGGASWSAANSGLPVSSGVNSLAI